ncbi:MAG: DNA primase [Acholeplasmataceae bacterium]|nr:DNA primase [Acholeplasmataceae bacterium]
MIDQKLIDQINEKTDIVDLVSQFIELAKRGKNYMGLCPFHQEKTPSFSVSPEKNIAKCMACGEGGSPINFFRKIKNIPFEEAAFELANRAGIEIKQAKIKKDPNENHYKLMQEVASFYQFNLKNSTTGQTALAYLYQRQMTDHLIEHFRFGYAPPHGDTLYQVLKDKGYAVSDMIALGVVKQTDQGKYYDLFSERIIFPITNSKGYVVGFSGRTLNPKDQIKYINSPETVIFKKGLLLYHFYEGLSDIRKEKQVILYEGFFDVISSYAAGMRNGVATMGTALTRDQAKLIKQVSDSVIVAYDGDMAGLKASDQAIPVLEKEKLKVEVLLIPEKMDPDDFIKAYGPEKYEALFGEFTKDAFAFRYHYYKMGKSFQNANDMRAFKTQVLGMLQFADVTVKEFYKQKLATDLNIPLESLQERKRDTATVFVKNVDSTRMLSRSEKAERYLIFEMLRDKKIATHVKSKLKSSDFADYITAEIRIKIENYYEDNESLDLHEFLDILNKEQRSHVQDVLLKDTLWMNETRFTEKDIEGYLLLIKEANLKRRLGYLKEKINKNEHPSQSDLDEYRDINNRLKNKP